LNQGYVFKLQRSLKTSPPTLAPPKFPGGGVWGNKSINQQPQFTTPFVFSQNGRFLRKNSHLQLSQENLTFHQKPQNWHLSKLSKAFVFERQTSGGNRLAGGAAAPWGVSRAKTTRSAFLRGGA
jgi:hypothetical protein